MKKIKALDKSDIAAFKKQADAILARIAKGRDELRELVDTYREILDSVEQGVEGFESAIDTISQLL